MEMNLDKDISTRDLNTLKIEDSDKLINLMPQ